MTSALALLTIGIILIGASGLEGGPGTGDTTAPDFTGAFVESPVGGGFEEDELSFHELYETQGV